MKLVLKIKTSNITGDARDVASHQLGIIKTRLQRLQEEKRRVYAYNYNVK